MTAARNKMIFDTNLQPTGFLTLKLSALTLPKDAQFRSSHPSLPYRQLADFPDAIFGADCASEQQEWFLSKVHVPRPSSTTLLKSMICLKSLHALRSYLVSMLYAHIWVATTATTRPGDNQPNYPICFSSDLADGLIVISLGHYN